MSLCQQFILEEWAELYFGFNTFTKGGRFVTAGIYLFVSRITRKVISVSISY